MKKRTHWWIILNRNSAGHTGGLFDTEQEARDRVSNYHTPADWKVIKVTPAPPAKDKK